MVYSFKTRLIEPAGRAHGRLFINNYGSGLNSGNKEEHGRIPRGDARVKSSVGSKR
jgi:hypothetical protein